MNSFGGDRGIVGKAMRISERPMTVIGVMPPRFDFPRLADVRTIMPWAPEARPLDPSGCQREVGREFQLLHARAP